MNVYPRKGAHNLLLGEGGPPQRWMRGGTQNRCGETLGEYVQAIGSPGRGAGPAIAGSEGSGFSLEKPPPEAECRPRYSKSPVFAPPAQGLAKGQAETPQSATLPAPLPGEPLSVRIRPGLLIPLLSTAPHQSRLSLWQVLRSMRITARSGSSHFGTMYLNRPRHKMGIPKILIFSFPGAFPKWEKLFPGPSPRAISKRMRIFLDFDRGLRYNETKPK